MRGGKHGRLDEGGHRHRQFAGVIVDDIAVARVLERVCDVCEIVGTGIGDVGGPPEARVVNREEVRRRRGIACGRQDDVVSSANKLLGEDRDDGLRPAVRRGRHGFPERGELQDTQKESPRRT